MTGMSGSGGVCDAGEIKGILCMYKPEGFTSFDVIAKLRGILKTRRLGHAGTLDPMAEGVLPVFAGNAAKAVDMLLCHDKTYRAEFALGIVTDTQDSTGNIISENDRAVSRDELEKAAGKFCGDIMQIPPMYSAVSVNGKRLYELAREGRTVERQPRPVTVYSLEILSYNENERRGQMEISCSKGTYVRTLINDIGEALGCGGIMTGLVRTAACGFSLDDCVTFEELQQAADRGENPGKFLLPVDTVFVPLPEIRLDEDRERMYRNGVKLDIKRLPPLPKGADRFRIYGAKGDFLGIAKTDGQVLRSEKNFY